MTTVDRTAGSMRVALLVLAIAVVSFVGIALSSPDAALADGPGEVIEDIEEEVEDAQNAVDGHTNSAINQIGRADTYDEVIEIQDRKLNRIDRRIGRASDNVTELAEEHPNHNGVQQASSDASNDLQAMGDQASAAIADAVESWLESNGVTTTIPPVPPTSLPPPAPTTTTTVPVTPTSTTLPPAPPTTTTTTTTVTAVPVPPADPPAVSDTAYLADLPAEDLAAAAPEAVETMAAVSLVRRVVDSQLPAGVSVVAAGPLVVIGLIIDAIRAAGGLMLVPWAILGIYMAGLLRGWRGFTSLGG